MKASPTDTLSPPVPALMQSAGTGSSPDAREQYKAHLRDLLVSSWHHTDCGSLQNSKMDVWAAGT